MSTPQHAIHSFIMGYILSIFLISTMSIPIIGLFIFFGIFPDIVPAIENKSINADKWEKWDWYKKLHKINILCIIPSFGLHILLDKYTHGHGRRWWIKSERLIYEIVGWIISLIIILWIING